MGPTLINSNIGKFELLEMYEYYDGPIIFSCKNASGNFFFASAVDEKQGKKRWFFLPVSTFRLKQILAGCLTIKSAFIHAEEPWLFEMCGNFASENSFDGRILYVNDINHDDLPDDDVFLDDIDSSIFLKCLSSEEVLETSTISESVAIDYLARQNWSDCLRKQEISVVGELVMIHSKKHEFELSSIDGFTYKGTLTEPLYRIKFEVPSFVEATLEESISTNAAKEQIYYSLLEVRELPTEEIHKLFD